MEKYKPLDVKLRKCARWSAKGKKRKRDSGGGGSGSTAATTAK